LPADAARALSGKSAVVTGGSSGIGRGIAVAFARSGADVVIVGRDPARLEETNELAGGRCHVLCLDLIEDGAPARLVDETLRTCGSLDVLVHAAGLFLPQPFEQASLDDFDRQWEVNVRAPYAVTRASMPHLRPDGSVIFISSIAGHVGFRNSAAYCATKGAVELMSKAMTLEFAGEGIRFNCIAPGNIRTTMNEHLFADPAYEKEMLGSTPSGRIGTVDDVAGAAVYLASDAASYVHGSSFVIDGGWVAG
jgi:NAD(P)-dependent dehydrogenase (short-subunit alcohol dehydrogenase family)